MKHPHEHHHHNNDEITKILIAAICIFSIAYMPNESNIDRFEIAKALEYISGQEMDTLPVHIATFVASFVTNIPMLAAIIHSWVNDHHEHSSKLESFVELVMIGGPFALIGVSAWLDTMGKFEDIKKTSILNQVVTYTSAAISGAVASIAAFKLHGSHIHEGMNDHKGGVKEFLKAFFKEFYTTYVVNVLAAHEVQSETHKKVFAVLNAFYQKYGNLFVHGFLGKFAADSFLSATGLGGKSAIFDGIMKVFLPAAVMLYEGNTEGRSFDKRDEQSYLLSSKLILSFLGTIHTLPAATALAELIGPFESGPLGGALYNTLTFCACLAILGPPSVNGFVATTIKGFETATQAIKNKVGSWMGYTPAPSRKDYVEIGPHESEAKSTCSAILAKFHCCCAKKENKEKFPLYLRLTDEERAELGPLV